MPKLSKPLPNETQPSQVKLEPIESGSIRSEQNTGTLPLYNLALLLSLYLAQGLPVGFLTQALPAILRKNNVSLAAIGGFGLLMAPWALKFLWAPLVDRHYSGRFGRSRSWIIPTQAITILLLAVIAFLEPSQLASPIILLGFFAVLFLINLMGATQDIATDGLAVRLLQKTQQQWGNAVQVLGSRLGFIFGGGAVLLLLDMWSWPVVFFCLTGLVLLNSLPILFFKEASCPESSWAQANKPIEPDTNDISTKNKTINRAMVDVAAIESAFVDVAAVDMAVINKARSNKIPSDKNSLQRLSRLFFKDFTRNFAHFWRDRQARTWLLVLLTFKLADSLSGAMVKPMMVDMGFSLANIGLMASMLGSVASVLGALLAAVCMRHMTRSSALWWFNWLQILSFSLYATLAWQFEHWHIALAWQVYTVNAFEQFAGAMALVAMLTLIMDYSRKQQAGSDFTFQVSILAMTGGVVHIFSGLLAQYLGYAIHFGFCVLLALVCLWPIMAWRRVVDEVRVKE